MSLKEIYFNSEHPVQQLLPHSLWSVNWMELIKERKKYHTPRQILQKVLHEQNTFLNLSDASLSNLQHLGDENTFTITTGHQLCLGTGPLFVIYKTISIIVIAKQLQKAFPDYRFVPIFWLASEDHDFQEINHLYLNYYEPITYNAFFRGAVGRHLIQKEHLPKSKLWTLTPYQTYPQWQQPFMHLLYQLFGNDGLLFLNPDHSSLKQNFIPVLKQELQEQFLFQQASLQNLKLKSLGIPLQWYAQPVNLFFLQSDSREKILLLPDGNFQIGDKIYTMQELLTLVEHCPECFSPNAGMRPLFQETLLPNLAYIGGWNELLYWLQLPKAFQHANIFFPLLIPRYSHIFFPQDALNQLLNHGLTTQDILQPNPHLILHIAQKYFDFQKLQHQFEQLRQDYTQIADTIKQFEQNLENNLLRKVNQLEDLHKQIRYKVAKVVMNKYPEKFMPILDLKQSIQPDGFSQERTLNIAAFVKNEDKIPDFVKRITDDLLQNYEILKYLPSASIEK